MDHGDQSENFISHLHSSLNLYLRLLGFAKIT